MNPSDAKAAPFAPDGPPDMPAFEAPWQAQAFAMVVALHEKGLFTWPDWAATLGAAIERHDDYHDAWIEALEAMLARHGVAEGGEIEALAEAWARAAEATPHGGPIVLENDPLATR